MDVTAGSSESNVEDVRQRPIRLTTYEFNSINVQNEHDQDEDDNDDDSSDGSFCPCILSFCPCNLSNSSVINEDVYDPSSWISDEEMTDLFAEVKDHPNLVLALAHEALAQVDKAKDPEANEDSDGNDNDNGNDNGNDNDTHPVLGADGSRDDLQDEDDHASAGDSFESDTSSGEGVNALLEDNERDAHRDVEGADLNVRRRTTHAPGVQMSDLRQDLEDAKVLLRARALLDRGDGIGIINAEDGMEGDNTPGSLEKELAELRQDVRDVLGLARAALTQGERTGANIKK
ncbi:unnamed protein product [Tilletia controversa]|uniref:Uncharacterized protein n=3 Tax=Tilletia TaxID=13289 RepID=A0A8X7SX18_9BASI|nr:hypothetical protein CF336_g3588 [Tilletia laevis]KAE8199329.1 hypothetical protein CF328_g3281 [Tilletia controversa]KAE8261865.1 hypothetical protein A4X03_0g2908 [Tilletia caries]KAE8204188.1 hypothetical protein CF335_g2743 [Tilletia laevis]KAE8248014.1 hypothetical protein A4X06_0g4022 [Tilletia controversa]